MAIPFVIRLLLWKDRFFDKKAENMEPAAARSHSNEYMQNVINKIDFAPIEMDSVEDLMIPMRDGHKIKARVYRPSPEDNLPVIVYYHGGGFVLYDIESHDRVCRRLADKNNALVISIDYRLAPEYKFPIPVNDCYDSLLWATDNMDSLRGNLDRLILAGDSAGGNLATVCCAIARDEEGPKIHAQILIYPTVDATFQFASIERNGKGYLLTKERMAWFVDQYAVDETDKSDPLFSPIYQEDLVGLPPAFLFTAEFDPLHDEGAAYAQKLKDAGVHTKYKMYEGMVHGFINMPKLAKPCLTAHDDISAFLNELEAQR